MLKDRNPLNEHAQHFAPFILSLSISFFLFLFCASMFEIWFGVTLKGCRSGQTTFVGMAYNLKVLGSIFLDNDLSLEFPHLTRNARKRLERLVQFTGTYTLHYEKNTKIIWGL